MKKQVAIGAAILISFAASAQFTLADEEWFKHHDLDHSGHLNYEEYAASRRAWEAQHEAERKWQEKELREDFKRRDLNHDRHLQYEEVKELEHHW